MSRTASTHEGDLRIGGNGVIALRLTCDRPFRYVLATLRREQDSATRTVSTSRVVIEVRRLPARPAFAGAKGRRKVLRNAGCIAEGGRVRSQGGEVRVENANAAHSCLPLPRLSRKDLAAKCDAYLAAAKRKTLAKLRSDHVADHRRFFRRVGLIWGRRDPTCRPTSA